MRRCAGRGVGCRAASSWMASEGMSAKCHCGGGNGSGTSTRALKTYFHNRTCQIRAAQLGPIFHVSISADFRLHRIVLKVLAQWRREFSTTHASAKSLIFNGLKKFSLNLVDKPSEIGRA